MDNAWNGWTNFETWDAYNWLTVDEKTTADAEQAAAEALAAADGDKEAAAEELAKYLRQVITTAAPDLGASLYADILDEALEHTINYAEVAAAFLE